jgi:hypothetical protein
VSNIAGLRRSVDAVAASSIQGQIESYKKEIFSLKQQKFLTHNICSVHVALIDGRISDVEATTTLLEEKLEPFNVAPRELSYHRHNK